MENASTSVVTSSLTIHGCSLSGPGDFLTFSPAIVLAIISFVISMMFAEVYNSGIVLILTWSSLTSQIFCCLF